MVLDNFEVGKAPDVPRLSLSRRQIATGLATEFHVASSHRTKYPLHQSTLLGTTATAVYCNIGILMVCKYCQGPKVRGSLRSNIAVAHRLSSIWSCFTTLHRERSLDPCSNVSSPEQRDVTSMMSSSFIHSSNLVFDYSFRIPLHSFFLQSSVCHKVDTIR